MPAHPLMRWIKNLVKNRGAVSRRDGRLRSEVVRHAPTRRWRPAIELLEDRTTPTLGLTTSTQMVVASDYQDGAVYAFDAATGALLQTLVAPSSNMPQHLSGMAVGPDGNLYFDSDNGDSTNAVHENSILEYNFRTQSLSTFISGSVLGSFEPPETNSEFTPGDCLTFGPDGNLYVDFNGNPTTSSLGGVLRLGITNSSGQLSYNNTEATIATGLLQPTNMTFGIGGDQSSLYVSDTSAGTVVKIAGATGGAPSSSTFVVAGSGGLESPYGLTWGPDGNLYVTDDGGTPPSAGHVRVYSAAGSFDGVFSQSVSSASDQYPLGEVFLPNGDLLTADQGGTPPDPNPADATLIIPRPQFGAISEFNANGTFASVFSAGTFPFSPTPAPGSTNFFPTQLVVVTVVSPSGSTVSLSPGTVNGAYDQTITASGGTGTVTLTVSNVTNPIAGLTLPPSGTNSLALTGRPTAPGTETFTVKAVDSLGATTTINYSITAHVSPTISAAFGPSGVVVEVVDSTGVLTQYDATGAHVLSGGVASASVAFGPSGEVLLVTFQDGSLVLYDAAGAHALAGGVWNASVAFGPTGEVLFVTHQDGSLVAYDATGAHAIVSGVASAGVAFGPSIEALYVVYGDDYLTEYDALGAHPLGIA